MLLWMDFSRFPSNFTNISKIGDTKNRFFGFNDSMLPIWWEIFLYDILIHWKLKVVEYVSLSMVMPRFLSMSQKNVTKIDSEKSLRQSLAGVVGRRKHVFLNLQMKLPPRKNFQEKSFWIGGEPLI